MPQGAKTVVTRVILVVVTQNPYAACCVACAYGFTNDDLPLGHFSSGTHRLFSSSITSLPGH